MTWRATRDEYGSKAATRRQQSAAPAWSPAAARSPASPAHARAAARACRSRSPSAHRSKSAAPPTWKPSRNGPPYAAAAAAKSPPASASSKRRASHATTSGSTAIRSPVPTRACWPSAERSTYTVSARRWRAWSAGLSGQSSAITRSRDVPARPAAAT
jgi:hypothetical protein